MEPVALNRNKRKLESTDDEEELQSAVILEERYFSNLIKLYNKGTDCFLISFVHLLAQMKPVVEWIRENADGHGAIVNELSLIFNRDVCNVARLREHLPAKFHVGKKDVTALADEMLKMLPLELRRMFCYVREPWQCTDCDYKREMKDEDKLKDVLCLSKMFTIERDCLEKIAVCDNCRLTNYHLQHFFVSDESRYLFVANSQSDQVKKYFGRRSGFFFLEVPWKMKAASEAKFWHYVTWVRQDSGYAVIDDHKTFFANNLVDLNDYNLFLLERMV